ncbi:hypothetical protein BRADI_3g39722v3 [Brachypodium distachyon]|uniref:Uncharacterized protein n=1 Tax=Brachypodium distachyon TaxID=15368 RepID=A0A0Q3FL10_BRADI|nr:hypothetical protein BRADI_3g39722v3 [Brachypodium distachyon]
MKLSENTSLETLNTRKKKLPGFSACQYIELSPFSELGSHGCLHAFALRKNRDDDGDEDDEITGTVSPAGRGDEDTAACCGGQRHWRPPPPYSCPSMNRTK